MVPNHQNHPGRYTPGVIAAQSPYFPPRWTAKCPLAFGRPRPAWCRPFAGGSRWLRPGRTWQKTSKMKEVLLHSVLGWRNVDECHIFSLKSELFRNGAILSTLTSKAESQCPISNIIKPSKPKQKGEICLFPASQDSSRHQRRHQLLQLGPRAVFQDGPLLRPLGIAWDLYQPGMKHHAAGLETCANQLRSEDGIRSLVSKRGNAWASQRGKHVMVRFNVSLQDFPSTLVSICKYVGQLSLPLRPGGQKIVILLFSRAGGEKCNITIIDFDVKNVGEVKM